VILFLKNLLFTVLVPGTVAVYIPLSIAGEPSPSSPWIVALAVLVFAAGTAIYTWCVWDFTTFGRGTPLPKDSPKQLVVRGLYRYMRNPMYVGVLTVILGWSLLFQSAILVGYAVFVGIVFHLVVVLYEERRLQRLFGDEYTTYCTRVRRWIPKVRPLSE
jgi:protein-S-isoprenylcysteine O-methyltransferase Ste14